MGKFKLNKSNFSFGHGTGYSPNKIIPLINVVGQAAKTYIAGKQGLKNIGIIKEDKTDLPHVFFGEVPVAGSQQALYNEILHQINKLKNNKNINEDEKKRKLKIMTKKLQNAKKQEQNKNQKLTWAEAKKNDPNLSKYVTERKKHKKGSPEYDELQKKINAAYKVKT